MGFELVAEPDLTRVRTAGRVAGRRAEGETPAERRRESHPIRFKRRGVDVCNVVTNHVEAT